jgi:hypothetical protein
MNFGDDSQNFRVVLEPLTFLSTTFAVLFQKFEVVTK